MSARLAPVQTLILGTSLIRYGIPDPDGGPAAASFGPTPLLRLGYDSASEEQLLTIATKAADQDVQRLYIEINPIVSRFAYVASGCGLAGWVKLRMSAMRQTLRTVVTGRDIIAQLLARPPEQAEPAILGEAQLTRLYPLRVTDPCFADRCTALFAAHPDMQVILIAMPRAPIARHRIGIDGMAQFHAAAHQFAAANKVPLFVVDPAGTWPTEAFVDQAHLSPAGAARFMAALSAFATELP